MGPTYPSQPKICQLERMVMIHHCIAKSAFRAEPGVCVLSHHQGTIVTALMSLMMHTAPTELHVLLVLVQNTCTHYKHVSSCKHNWENKKKMLHVSPSPWSQPL